MTPETQTAPARPEQRPRAVFSTDDFQLMREALSRYLQADDVKGGPRFERASHLYHRLGRVA